MKWQFMHPRRDRRITHRFVAGSVVATALGWALLIAGGSASRRAIVADRSIVVAQGTDASDAQWLDCVSVIHVLRNRGIGLANSVRFGESNSVLRTAPRLAELGDADLRSFCDWKACVETNGYGHACGLTDAGWEVCRVCDSGADCGGYPVSQDDCVAHAHDADRAQCHVGLLQECTLQRALRGPQDPRVTLTCEQSAEACAGQLPGDLATEALAAQHETDQVTVEVLQNELDLADQLDLQIDGGDDDQVKIWRQILLQWEGGLPTDVDGAVDGGS